MDAKAEKALTCFLQQCDEREFDYHQRGRLVAVSFGDGTGEVTAIPSPVLVSASPGAWNCASPQDVFDALHAGMAVLCDEDDVDDTVEAFIDLLRRPRRD